MNSILRPLGRSPATSTRSGAIRAFASPCNGVCKRFLSLSPTAFSGLVPATNETAPPVAKAIGAVNETLAEGDWVRVAPFGEFPNPVGRQIVDRQAAEAMVAAFNSISTRLATLWRGLPVYEGHPDDAAWRAANPGSRAVAVGRVKEMAVREDGLWGRVAWNDKGDALVRGDAPAYTAHSPHWGMLPVSGRPGKIFRPVELFSLGLTNQPNLPDTLLGVNEAGGATIPPNPMREKIIALLAALGRPVSDPATVTDEQLVTAANEAAPAAAQLVSQAAQAGPLTTQLATARAETTAAVNEATQLRTQLGAERTARAELIVVAAINEGRLTQAQREEWLGKFTAAGADFAAVSAELGKVKKAINTRSQVDGIGARKGEAATGSATITAINEAVAEKVKAGTGYDEAFAAVRREKPELFKPANAAA